MILDTKPDYQEHLKDKLSKISRTILLLTKLQKILTKPPLLTIYMFFTRSHLDYGEMTYYKAYNTSFHQNSDEIQHNSALAITEAKKEISKEKFYLELRLESLKNRRCYGKLYYFSKIFNKQSPTNLFNIIPMSIPIPMSMFLF